MRALELFKNAFGFCFVKLLNIQPIPEGFFPYLHASPGRDNWGNQGVLRHDLPFFKAEVDFLPKSLDALVLTSDLQGVVVEADQRRLLGEALPEFLAMFLRLEMKLNPEKVGIVLAGDFFATLESRGGLDDVRPVWRTFRRYFRWVTGVGGNHDDFGVDLDALPAFRREPGIFYLKNEEVALDGLRIGGISGVAGDNGKHMRIPEDQFAAMLKRRIDRRPDLLLLHQNPFHHSTPHKGGQFVTAALQKAPAQLLVCGHAIWEQALIQMENAAQVLNVGERVVILVKQTTS
ncbi:MAG: hypothetical protein IPL65_02285 [Lewinellaceae bacterium]|nr:hypothetical protein [Lewinellaceae bacterium]